MDTIEAVQIVIRLAVGMPEDPDAADQRADNVSDQIVDAIERKGILGVYQGSVEIIDWTSEPRT